MQLLARFQKNAAMQALRQGDVNGTASDGGVPEGEPPSKRACAEADWRAASGDVDRAVDRDVDHDENSDVEMALVHDHNDDRPEEDEDEEEDDRDLFSRFG